MGGRGQWGRRWEGGESGWVRCGDRSNLSINYGCVPEESIQ